VILSVKVTVCIQGEIMMNFNIDLTIIAVVMFFIILISIQLTLNKILLILKEIKAVLLTKKDK
jgi:uncharacterized Tic20 family protein